MADMNERTSRSLNLKVPLVIASGPGGFGEYGRIQDFPWQYVGAFTLKTVTLNPKEGNKPPRMFARDGFLINRIGLQNPGADGFIKTLEEGALDCLFEKTAVILSLGGDTHEEYVEISKRFARYIHRFAAVEFNFSCPNVKLGGLSVLADRKGWMETLVRVRETLQDAFLVAKLGIEGGFIEELAETAWRAGWDGVTVINTVRGLMFDGDGRLVLGGLSGPNLLPIAMRAVYEVRRRLPEIYIIASGGLYTPEDALKFIQLGANAVSVGSALFKNEMIIAEIGKALVGTKK